MSLVAVEQKESHPLHLDIIKCICGQNLKKMSDATAIYKGCNVICDHCRKRGNKGETFWHCTHLNTIHPDGFDSCNKCSRNYRQSPLLNNSSNKAKVVYDKRCIAEDVTKCDYLHTLKTTLNNYKNEHYHCEDILETLNSYLHLIHNHNSDKEFEIIYHELGECDINTCHMFSRHRYQRKCHSVDINDRDIVWYSILGKIHCHYQHCYDIGNKLSNSEKAKINDLYQATDEKKEDDADFLHTYLSNEKLLKTSAILQSKRAANQVINNVLKQRMSKKYNDLFENNLDVINDMYSFGYQFKYGYDGENEGGTSIPVSAKYTSLKDELINNTLSKVSINQFNAEYAKAEVHFNSDSRKETFHDCKLQYIFSIMIYCNFDQFQYQFSKTYRDNEGKDHEQFYFLGKYLKIAVHNFGTDIKDENMDTFYHGIGAKLLLPMHMCNFIHGPLSTSSSFVVASHFTNGEGLILQFSNNTKYAPKYFSCSWLSDYSNESECLFIQNYDWLQLGNIYNTKTGHEFEMLLRALDTIHNIITAHSFIHTAQLLTNISERIQDLIIKIILDRFRLSSLEYEPFESLCGYGRKLVDVYFKNQKTISMDYSLLKQCNDLQLLKLFFITDYEWIKLQDILQLFPNLEDITIWNVNLCSSTFDDIVNCLNNTKISKFNSIMFKFENAVDHDLFSWQSKYQQLLPWWLNVDINRNSLLIMK